MQKILKSLEEHKTWKQFLKKSCRNNKIGIQIANYFTPNKIRSVYQRLLKLYETKNQEDSVCWFQNQLKAFHWFLAILSGLKDIQIENFNHQQWSQMGEIFLNKDSSVMQYEAIKLVNERIHKNRQWSEQETELLTEIIKQNQNSNKWNDIARKLFQRSEHNFFRSGKQCRQRWLNHLDPNKKRGQWQEQEDKKIVKYILFNGRRWSNISKELGNHRTQHMVKNRYKTLIIKQKKLTPRISNENSLVRQLAKRLLGQAALPKKNQQILIREQIPPESMQLSCITEQQKQDENDENQIVTQKIFHKKEKPKVTQTKIQFIKHEEKRGPQIHDQKSILRDPILSHVVEEVTKPKGAVSTPLSNYQLQQIYSPFYINYQGITPYLSTSPSLPFFMNSSFSSLDNSFNQNLFIKPSQPSSNQKKQEVAQ